MRLHHHDRRACLLLSLSLAVLPAVLGISIRAQEPQPDAKPAAKKTPDEVYRPEQEEPAVQVIMESKPTTPPQLLRSVDLLIDLGRAPLARGFVKQLLAANMDEETMYNLAEKAGSASLLKMAASEHLAPEGSKLADAIMIAADKVRSDPARLATLVKGLSDPAPLVRQQATAGLSKAHGAAVTPLLRVLTDPQRAAEYPGVRAMLVRLGDDAIDPLVAALQAPDQALQAHVAELLGRMGVKAAVPQLAARSVSPESSPALRTAARDALRQIVGAAPSTSEAQTLLKREIERQLERSRRGGNGSEPPVEVWHWDLKQQRSMAVQYSPLDAALAIAARLADDLRKIDAEDQSNRRLFLATMLEIARYRGGLDKPLPTEDDTAYAAAATFGPDVIDDLLVHLLATQQIAAATAAAQILGDIGSFDILARSGPQPCPLVQAVRHGDRRLRFAAMDAILKIGPTEPFAGSSSVTESLAFFAATSGAPRVLVGHPRSQQGQQLAGLLASLGYESDLATNSRRAFELATTVPDYEFAMLHRTLDKPAIDELIKQLRKDSRTRQLPIGIVTPLEELSAVERLARTVPKCEAFARTQSVEALQPQVDQLLSHLGRHRVAIDERRRQATVAMDWLVILSGKPQRIFDLSLALAAVERAMYVPELTSKGLEIFAALGTATGQRQLIDTANRMTEPLDVRQAAAEAFGKSAKRYGVLLTSGEILQQYDRYNASEKSDAETQQVLASILDTIEAKKKETLQSAR